jgi:uncharacterized membrane protein YidH (DUF202 family)
MVIENDAGATALPSSTELALDRTHLAHERTLMAWVRTATSLISLLGILALIAVIFRQ